MRRLAAASAMPPKLIENQEGGNPEDGGAEHTELRRRPTRDGRAHETFLLKTADRLADRILIGRYRLGRPGLWYARPRLGATRPAP